MRKLENFKLDQLPLWQIVAVTTSPVDYEMDRTILVENYPEGGEFTIVYGEHCSCFDFDGVRWEAIAYTPEELVRLAVLWAQSPGYGSQALIVPLVKAATHYPYRHLWQEAEQT